MPSRSPWPTPSTRSRPRTPAAGSSTAATLSPPTDPQSALEVRITRQAMEDRLEHALQRPPAEALEDRIPVPEPRLQVAPGRAGPGNPKNRFKKQPVIGCRTTGIARLSRKQRRNPRPLLIAQYA